jgi:hypothetical protein
MKTGFFGTLGLVTALSVLAFAPKASAYFSTIDTAELIEPQKYQVSLEPQLILSRYDGLEATGRLDTGINESSSVRGILGFGTVDFQVGGFYKFIPFPDTANQPAIGGEAGVIIARVKGNSEVSVRLHPLVSKKFETEIGDVIPYASLPFGITNRVDGTFVPFQLVGGAELRALNTPQISYFAELGINLNQAFSYISLAVAYRFDEAAIHH